MERRFAIFFPRKKICCRDLLCEFFESAVQILVINKVKTSANLIKRRLLFDDGAHDLVTEKVIKLGPRYTLLFITIMHNSGFYSFLFFFR